MKKLNSSKNQLLTPGQVLDKIPGLTRDKLSYWSERRYLPVVIQTRSGRDFKYYKRADLPIIKMAYELICKDGLKDKKAFLKIYDEFGVDLRALRS